MAFAGSSLAAQQPSLQATLTQLNDASAKFNSAQATFRWDNFTRAVNDHDLQDGATYTIRSKSGSEVGYRILGKGARTVVYKNGVARDFTAGLNCYNTYGDVKNKATIESLLTLSFGSSGKDLNESWNVNDMGPETVDGVKVEKLDLTPKTAGLKNNISHITLWTDLSRAVSLKQVVYSPSGDTQTAVYSNIKVNGKVNTSGFEIKGKPCSK